MDEFRKTYEVLKQIGFTENEVRAYMALLQKEQCTPAEVGHISGLPRKKVYDILKSLEAKGGCVQLNTARRFYMPTNPEIITLRVNQAIESIRESAVDVKAEMAQLYKHAIEADAGVDYITYLKDPVQIAEKVINLTANSKEEILVFSRSSVLAGKIKKFDKKVLENLDRKDQIAQETIRKMKVKHYTITCLRDLNINYIKDFTGDDNEYRNCDNMDIRIVDDVPCKIMVVDTSNIMIGLESRSNKFSVLTFHMKDEGLARVIRNSFYHYFDNAPSIRDLDVDILLNEKRIVMLGDKHKGGM